jgi:hypothetical protein
VQILVLGLRVNPSRHSVHDEIDPEQEVHGDWQAWHVPLMLVNPLGQDETHCPFKKIPLAHEQTPLIALDPLGQTWTQLLLDKEYPLKHEVHTL